MRDMVRKRVSQKIPQPHGLLGFAACLGLLLGLGVAFFTSSIKANDFTPEPAPNLAPKTDPRASNAIPLSEAEAEPIWQAYLERYEQAVLAQAQDPLTGLFSPVLDQAFLSADAKTAVLWLGLRDPNGYLLHTEPGLVIALRLEADWQILLPDDAQWQAALAQLEPELIPAALQSAPELLESPQPQAPISGYYLPFAAGTKHKLEGSVLHFHSYPPLGYPSCDESQCRYAYDFTDAGHFPLLSARAGTVISSRDSCTDGNTGCTNYIVIQDVNGGTYQLYLHIAHNTIPDHLIPGTYIGRGNYIGDTDDTGYSTSEHVHFMVTRSFYYGGDGYPWGNSVDIRFNDVMVNGGIPRTCFEVARLPIYDGATECLGDKGDPFNAANDWFRSGNIGASPPTGTLITPAAGATVAAGNNPLMDVRAQTQDDVRVVRAVLQANLNGKWQEIGPRVSNPSSSGVFDWDVDLCKTAPINGPLEIALKLWDHEGNVVEQLSKRTVQVDHACPPPVSQLTAPTVFNGTGLKLNWTAQSSGVPIRHFQLQWREGAQAWSNERMMTLAADSRAVWFVGLAGKSFGFRLRAVDINNQAETWIANNEAEVTHVFPSGCQPDAAEPDGTIAEARLATYGREYIRNICGQADSDWFRVNVGEYGLIRLRVNSLNGGSSVKLSVFSANGAHLLATKQAAGHGKNVVLTIPVAGRSSILIKAESSVPNHFGTDVQYGFTATGLYPAYLPMIFRK